MTRSMPKSRQQFRKEQAIEASLRSELRAGGVTRHSQREKLMQKAASSRPADLPQIARAELAKWRRNREIQKALNTIAGQAT